MTIDEIKVQYPVKDVARQEGVEVTRSGFCRCIYHPEKTPSMKLYEYSFYSFCCGKRGDVIDFIRQLHGFSFQDACVYLTGEKAGYKTRQRIALAKMRQRDAERRKTALRQQLRVVNEPISFNRRVMLLFEPTDPDTPIDDRYAEAVHGYTKYVGLQEMLMQEIEDEKRRYYGNGQVPIN